MFETSEQLLNAYVKFTDTELNSPSVPASLMEITVDGTTYVVVGTPNAIQRVSDLINAINNSAAGDHVTASVTYNAEKTTYQVTLTANSTAIPSITVANNSSLIFARGVLNQSDPTGEYANGVDSIEVIPVSDPEFLDQIEPKNEGDVLERVFLPIHTRITSDEPELDINYWANYIHNTDHREMTPVSVAAATHPTTGEPVVYIMYIATHDCFITIECRYANGVNKGTLVSGINNQVTLPATNLNNIDTYYGVPKVYSGTLVYDPVLDRLYTKVIVGGQFYTNTQYSNNGTFMEIMCVPRDLDIANITWTLNLNMGTSNNVPQGNGIYQRSDGGLVVDSSGNIIAVACIAAYQDDPGTSNGDPDVTPGFSLYKINPTGNILWTKNVYSEWYTSNTNGVITVVPDLPHAPFDSHYPFSATIDVKPNGDIYVGHCVTLHKFNTNGLNVWAKYFPAFQPSHDVFVDHTNTPIPTVYSYISGVQVHPTENVIYVATGGALVTSTNNTTRVIPTIFKIADSNVGDYTPILGAFCFSPLSSVDIRMSAPFYTYEYWLNGGLSFKLNAATDSIFATTKTSMYGDPDTSTPAKGLVVAKITASTMSLVWAYDNAIVDWFGGNTDPLIYLDGPIPMHGYDGPYGGYINFDVVTDSNDVPTAVTFGTPMWYNLNTNAAPARGGWVITQSIDTPPISSVTTGDIQYAFTDVTARHASWNTTALSIIDMGAMSAHNGTSVNVPAAYYNVLAQLSTGVSRTPINISPWMKNWLFTLPPMTASVTPSLYVDNIARVGELQLGGVLPAPSVSTGTAADKKGMLRVNADGIFYCTADYDGSTPIWKTVLFDGDEPKFRTIPPGVTNGIITGGPADKVGEIYITPKGIMLVCVGEYNGTSSTWAAGLPAVSPGVRFTPTFNTDTSLAQPEYWPTGEYVSEYDVTLYVDVPMDIAGGCVGRPGAGAAITNFVVPRTMWITSEGAGTGLWRCGVAPTADATLTLWRNRSTIGSIKFNAGSTVGAVVTSWGVRQLFMGDVITVIAPASQDSTLSDVYFSIVGWLNL